MKSRWVELLALTFLLCAISTSAEEKRHVPIVAGAVPVDRATDAPYQGALLEGLGQLGYINGANIQFIARYADGDPAKLRKIIKELIDMQPDILVGDARLLKEATDSIPIVSPTMGDPVRTGLVASLAHPGGNLTGLSAQSYDLWPKQLELARELVPNLTRLAFLFDTNDEPDAASRAREFSALARREGLTCLSLPVSSYAGIQAALKRIRKDRVQVLVIWSSPLLTQHRTAIVNAIGQRLPVISDGRFFAESGALLTYSVDWPDLFRRSATYVDRIVKGAKPADLPIEQPPKFELVVNMRTAETLRIKIPESILLRADKIIR